MGKADAVQDPGARLRSSARSAGSRSRATAPIARRCATRWRCCRRASRLAIFPEGTRQHGPKIQPLQPGAAYLALRADVPIVPVGMAGTEEILRSGRTAPALRSRGDRGGGAVGTAAAHDERSSPCGGATRSPRELAEALQRAFDEALELRNGAG